jgi:hypothetical protein
VAKVKKPTHEPPSLLAVIRRPLPDRMLHPNGSKRPAAKVRRLQREYKDSTYYATRELNIVGDKTATYDVLLKFFLTPRAAAQKPDRDNLIAWMKWGLDGVAMGLGIDDNQFRTPEVWVNVDRDYPRVEVLVALGDFSLWPRE